MNSTELRSMYLKYFEDNGHTVRPSSSLIPDDTTLLFTVAGMVPFKNHFLGRIPLTYTRAASSQKCIRTNDIDNVGKTRRHHTFFEMLGNFSFGDYFKKEAIKYAWEFLTERVKLPKDRLYVTVYKDDQQAFDIWTKDMKIPPDRVFGLGKDTNFWEMGTVGPCGYCSEIYYDFEPANTNRVTASEIETNDNRFLEVWNLVFTEFDKQADGSLGELKQKNIDTGMGLERLSAVSQGVLSNFDSDLFMPLIGDVAAKSGVAYGKSPESDVSLRVVADHARGVSFLIGDGVIPSNEGRGYVLRRLIRRAARHGRSLGFKKQFLFDVVPTVMKVMGAAYPETAARQDYIMQIIRQEEEKFRETMDKGMDILSSEIDQLSKNGGKMLSGDVAFKLYDTYGFPVEITSEILREKKMDLDSDGFKKNMETQRETAKRAYKGFAASGKDNIPEEALKGITVTDFKGYEALAVEGCRVLEVFVDGRKAQSINAGGEGIVVLDRTPCYGEGGGQCGDTGTMTSGGNSLEITDTQKSEGVYLHRVKALTGSVKKGDTFSVAVSVARRKAIMKNHTGTHLLQAALRSVLGPHVEQSGSYVGEDRLRFDFTHFAALTSGELGKVEKEINRWVQESIPVDVRVMTVDEAKKTGAMALFDDKYKGDVRVVSVGEVSKELCAGTHLHNIGEIGLFKIVSSSSTAAGIRRIEALTGMAAYDHVTAADGFIQEMKESFKAAGLQELSERIKKTVKDSHELEKKVADMKRQGVLSGVDGYLKGAKEVNGATVLAVKLADADKDTVRELGDILRQKVKKAVIVIAAVSEGKVSFVSMVSDELTDRFDASKIVKQVAAVCQGGGGGKKNMAEAGGKDPSKVDEALAMVEKAVMG